MVKSCKFSLKGLASSSTTSSSISSVALAISQLAEVSAKTTALTVGSSM